jgi:hypothetical protein
MFLEDDRGLIKGRVTQNLDSLKRSCDVSIDQKLHTELKKSIHLGVWCLEAARAQNAIVRIIAD